MTDFITTMAPAESADWDICKRGVILVTGQKVALGRVHKHQTVTVLVSETTLAIELDDQEVCVVRRTTTQPMRSIKGRRPRNAASIS